MFLSKSIFFFLAALSAPVAVVSTRTSSTLICEGGDIDKEWTTRGWVIPCVTKSNECSISRDYEDDSDNFQGETWDGFLLIVYRIICHGEEGKAALCWIGDSGSQSVRETCPAGEEAVATFVYDESGRRLRGGADQDKDPFNGACTMDFEDEEGNNWTMFNPKCAE